MSAKIGISICTPLREFRGPDHLPKQIGKAMRELIGRPDAQQYSWEFMAAVGGMCRARNTCVHEFLKGDGTWLLWWDADLHDSLGSDADAILRLLSHKQPIVGGIYCKRSKRPTWVATWLAEAKEQPEIPGVVQVQELGGGFKLYHRQALLEIRRIFGELPLQLDPATNETLLHRDRDTGEMMMAYFLQTIVGRDFLSEDFYLDYLCRRAGIPIFADIKVRLRHMDHDGSVYPVGEWPPVPAEDAQ